MARPQNQPARVKIGKMYAARRGDITMASWLYIQTYATVKLCNLDTRTWEYCRVCDSNWRDPFFWQMDLLAKPSMKIIKFVKGMLECLGSIYHYHILSLFLIYYQSSIVG